MSNTIARTHHFNKENALLIKLILIFYENRPFIFKMGYCSQYVKTYDRTQLWTTLYTYIHKQHNKTLAFLQATWDKDEPNIVFMWKS